MSALSCSPFIPALTNSSLASPRVLPLIRASVWARKLANRICMWMGTLHAVHRELWLQHGQTSWCRPPARGFWVSTGAMKSQGITLVPIKQQNNQWLYCASAFMYILRYMYIYIVCICTVHVSPIASAYIDFMYTCSVSLRNFAKEGIHVTWTISEKGDKLKYVHVYWVLSLANGWSNSPPPSSWVTSM